MAKVTLRVGSRGGAVKELQRALNLKGYKVSTDGIFGSGTKSAVVLYQISHQLTGDGIVGTKTWNALLSETKYQTISPAGIKFIQSFEGFSSKAYDDGVGVWTLGWGTIQYENGVRVKKGDEVTVARALELFMHDLSRFEVAVRKNVKVPLNQNQYDALVSFTYNVGIGGFSGSSLLSKLNSGNYQGAADGLLSWNKGRVGGVLREIKGLTRRRKAERDLFLKV
jgi:lysozyme